MQCHSYASDLTPWNERLNIGMNGGFIGMSGINNAQYIFIAATSRHLFVNTLSPPTTPLPAKTRFQIV